MATLTVRLSDELKSDATEVAEYYGFDLGSLTRAFYTQMVRDCGDGRHDGVRGLRDLR